MSNRVESMQIDVDEIRALRAEVARLKAENAELRETLDATENNAAEQIYRGNSARHWHDKAKAYGGIVFAVCEAFRRLGYTGEMGDLSTLADRLGGYAEGINRELTQASAEVARLQAAQGLERPKAPTPAGLETEEALAGVRRELETLRAKALALDGLAGYLGILAHGQTTCGERHVVAKRYLESLEELLATATPNE